MTLRVVLDTNTVISALLWQGTPSRVLNAGDVRLIRFYTSPFLLWELSRTLAKGKFEGIMRLRNVSVDVLVERYADMTDVVEPDSIPNEISDDPPDNHVLACAVKANADVIVSGDGHLKALGKYAGIPIMNAAGFLNEFLPRGN